MKSFVRNFRREGNGVWVCIEPATLEMPSGRIQVTPGSRFTRGTTFMGVELAKLLDEQQENDQR